MLDALKVWIFNIPIRSFLYAPYLWNYWALSTDLDGEWICNCCCCLLGHVGFIFSKQSSWKINDFSFYMFALVSYSVLLIVSPQISGCFATFMGSLFLLFSSVWLQSPCNSLLCERIWTSLNGALSGFDLFFMSYYFYWEL